MPENIAPKKYILKSSPGPESFKIDYAKELNAEQLEVIRKAEGACLVLAGAGSGKTRTLIYRVAYLLEKGVHPEEILLVTFTNKAAQEMRSRVEALLKGEAKGLWCGTFHHIGNRVLRRYGKSMGLSEDFGILDEEDSRDLIKACMKSLEISSTKNAFPKPSAVQSLLSFAANTRLKTGDALAKHAPHFLSFSSSFEKIRVLYEEKKRKTNNLDYDDLILRWIELLEKSPEVRERLTRQFRYCLVDEYQDTNRLQNEVIRILSSHHKNILVVGDDAQSIYSFRGAEIRNILDFPEVYSGSKIFKLETNYRSVKPILDLANESIRNNVHQFPKTLKTVLTSGKVPQFVRVRDGRQEARFVVQRIQEMVDSGIDLNQIAVLFRAHYQAAELEMELAKSGINYIVRGGVRFFEQAHIKDVLAYLRLVQNPMDEIAWIRALTLYPGIGGVSAEKIFRLIEQSSGNLEKILAPGFESAMPSKARESFLSFKKTLKSLSKDVALDRPDSLIETVLEKGYNQHVLLNFENAQERLEDLRELVNFAHTYKSLKSFLSDTALREGFAGESFANASAQDEAVEQLVLSTIHQAKGLEWKAVFVIRLSEGQFPHAKAMDNEIQIEEERRLFYVASTRAKEELILVHPMTRYDYNVGTVISRESPFVAELSHRLYEELEIEEEAEQEETIYLD